MKSFSDSFTICTAFSVKEWSTYTQAVLYKLYSYLPSGLREWHSLKIYAKKANTVFEVMVSNVMFQVASTKLYFPLDWTRVCFTFDKNSSKVLLIVDEEQLDERILNETKKLNRAYLQIGDGRPIKTGLVADPNIFSPALPVESMKRHTKAGDAMCRVPGNFLCSSKIFALSAKRPTAVELDHELQGPCRKEAAVHVFPVKEAHWNIDCMEHCKKLGGRSPSVRTNEEWRALFAEVSAISPRSARVFSRIWISATEGDVEQNLGKPSHWPEEIVAKEGIWSCFGSSIWLLFCRPVVGIGRLMVEA